MTRNHPAKERSTEGSTDDTSLIMLASKPLLEPWYSLLGEILSLNLAES